MISISDYATDLKNASALLGVLMSHAPDAVAQAKCHQFHQSLILAGLRQESIEIELACALTDGLRFGNWLWLVIPTSPASPESP